MNYRTILLDAIRDEAHEARLRTARALASRFDAALVGLHALPAPIAPASYNDALIYGADELLEAQRKLSQAAHERARTTFEQICGSGAGVTFESADGDPGRILARNARASDLVLVSHGQVPALGVQGTLEQVVTGAGVPVLMLPGVTFETVGQVVIAGWNGSREAARALHAALPFLAAADSVTLCAIGGGTRPSIEDAAAMLRRHGVVVRARQIDQLPDGNAGEILLEEAATLGADLLVMGAYGHARLREMVFGGATRHVLREARLPVLFSG